MPRPKKNISPSQPAKKGTHGIQEASLVFMVLLVTSVIFLGFPQGVLIKNYFWHLVDRTCTLHHIHVEGLRYTSQESIYKKTGIKQDIPLRQLKPETIRQQLLALPWVKEALVHVQWPSKLHLSIKEHVPLALFIKDKKRSLISDEGHLIDTTLPLKKHFVILHGPLALTKGPEALKHIQNHLPFFLKRLHHLMLLRTGQYQLGLLNGPLLLIPANTLIASLKRVFHFEQKHPRLFRRLAQIDLSAKDRLIVTPLWPTTEKQDKNKG